MSIDTKLKAALLLTVAVLLFGCTANPQDLAKLQNQQPASSASPNYNSSSPISQTTPSTSSLMLTLQEIAKHNTASDCWMAINGAVLDLSSFVGHPGGSTYVPYCGTDATAAFNDKGGRGSPHSAYADSLLASYTIGQLGQTITVAANAGNSAAGNTALGTAASTPAPTATPQRYYRDD